MPFTQQITTEEIAKHYASALDSVDLINTYQSNPPSYLTEEEVTDAIDRNKKHLEIMLAKDYWTTEDLSPLEAAVL